ncbi:MAG: exonuclease domain-containing protein [Lachnospiraceae bacterium]|nr:exonuclease domain-containing protein [Lachnospiraceae bacterium]
MNKIFVDFEMQPIKRTFIQKRKVVRNEVIEFGAVMLDENDKEISSFKEYVRPVFTIDDVPAYLRDLTGISYSMIKNADRFENVLHRFIQWCKASGEYVIYAWSESDLDQITGEIILKDIVIDDDIEYMVANWIDLQAEFGAMIGEKKKLNLSKALQMTGTEFVGKKHDALYDSRNTAEVYWAMQDKDALLNSIKYTEDYCEKEEHINTLGSMFDLNALMAAIA